ncbi:MAG: hypothetical protein HQL10_10170 [Nitrospirae bacterium]|nr:hypothetical protein [Nitrospirota bacterium]
MQVSGAALYQSYLNNGFPNPVNSFSSPKDLSKNQIQNSVLSAADISQQQAIQSEVQRLKTQEQKVMAHERAHQSAGGQYAGAANYQYTVGPDGKRYITGGEVQIDISPENTPSATITKMEQVKRAALAPADPSGQDRNVAATADGIKAQAKQEQARENNEAASTGYNQSGNYNLAVKQQSINFVSIFG